MLAAPSCGRRQGGRERRLHDAQPAVVADAWSHLTFTDDPVATSLHAAADHAVQVGLLAKPNLVGMFDLTLLDKVLNKAGEKEVVAR